jgi:hypothetical protein
MKFVEKHKLKVLLANLKSDVIIKSNDFNGNIEIVAVRLSGGNF